MSLIFNMQLVSAEGFSVSNDRVFVSYSHRGNGPKWKSALLKALEVFDIHHLLDVWEDRRIRTGYRWHGDIQQAISSASVAVVLLTKEALESKYILEDEFPPLRERQRTDLLPVIPVVCEPCDWKSHEWLQALQGPNSGNPLSQLSKLEQASVFRRLATDIANEVSRLALGRLPRPKRRLSQVRVYFENFPLTQESGRFDEKLIGREQELALLDLAFSQRNTAISSLVAWGGAGKSMLVKHWLRRLQREKWFGVKRVYAWSFFSQGTKEDRQTSEDSFLSHALKWFGVRYDPKLPPLEKGNLLAEAVSREHTLLILDGIEPLQNPPTRMGGELRAPGVRALLQRLANAGTGKASNCKCLITTREPLTDLAGFERREGSAWGSVLRLDLRNLTDEAGAALLHHAGANQADAAIEPNAPELVAASREVDGHPLTLHLLGRFLARAHEGDIRCRKLVKFKHADRKVQGGTTFKTLKAFERWFADGNTRENSSLAVLRMLGLFDRPAERNCINELRKPPILPGLTDALFVTRLGATTDRVTKTRLNDQSFNSAVSYLTEFGLVDIAASGVGMERTLDCHPLIREYFSCQLFKNHRKTSRTAHRRLYEYLASTVEHQPNTILELQPLYQAIWHGSKACMQESAYRDIFVDRVLRGFGESGCYSTKVLGAVGHDLAAVACFFEKPWSKIIKGISPVDSGPLLEHTAFLLRATGQVNRSLGPIEAALDFAARAKRLDLAGDYCAQLGATRLGLGDIAQSCRHCRMAVEFSDRSDDLGRRVMSRVALAFSLHAAGRRIEGADANSVLQEARSLAAGDSDAVAFLKGFRYWDVALASAEKQAWAIFLRDENGCIAEDEGSKQKSTICLEAIDAMNAPPKFGALLEGGLNQLILGRSQLYLALATPPGTKRKSLLSRAHTALTRANQALLESSDNPERPYVLLACALSNMLRRSFDAATDNLNEALQITERSSTRIHLTDIHLHRARLFFREDHYPWKSPQDDLAAAEKLVKQCGYHRRDQELSDAKRAILSTKWRFPEARCGLS